MPIISGAYVAPTWVDDSAPAIDAAELQAMSDTIEQNQSDIAAQDQLKAPLDSPAFTGTPTAPTAVTGTETTQIATTEFVQQELEAAIADKLIQSVSITDTTTTLGDMATMLNTINTNGEHVFFDVSALAAQMYLCTVFIDTVNNVYKIFDTVTARYAEGTYNASTLLTMAIAQASPVATQAQIDYLQSEIDELGGHGLKVNWDALGTQIYNGTDDIEAGDTVDMNWIASVLGTTTSGLTVTCSDMDTFINGVGEAEAATYLFVYDGTDWTYNSVAIDLADFGLSVSGTPATGEVMTIVTTVDARNYTFVSHDTINPVDANVPHNWALEQTYAPTTKAYDTYEALFAVYPGKYVPAGNYHLRNYCYRNAFYVDMYLTISSMIGDANNIVQAASTGYNPGQSVTNADGVTKAGVYTIKGIKLKLYGSANDAGSAPEDADSVSIAYTAESGVTYTELTDLNVDANDPVVYVNEGQFDKAVFGNSQWPGSNMQNWLCSDDPAKTTYTPSHTLDRPSAYNFQAGFLWGMDPRVRNLIQTAEVLWTSGCGNPDYTQNATYTAENDVFLLSMKEMSFDLNTAEGVATELYSEYTGNTLTNDAVAARAKYNRVGGTLNSYRWSRSAFVSYASIVRYVTSTGSNGIGSAFNGYYFAPAFIIGKSSIA